MLSLLKDEIMSSQTIGNTVNLKWELNTFDQLNIATLYQILQLRNRVFIVEQNCPYLDLDDKDQEALHLWASNVDGNMVAYCRLLPPGIVYPEVSLGRVVTDSNIRKSGAGRLLMLQALDYIQQKWPLSPVRINAQLYLHNFYQSLGFEAIGDSYLEDNIPHIEMLKTSK